MNRKDTRADDDTGIIKLSLWGSVINLIPKSGVYHLHNESVKQLQGVMSLSTTPHTIIEIPTREIKTSKTSLAELVSSTIHLPPSTQVQC